MNENRLNQTVDILKAIAHPTRLKILILLASRGPQNVTSIQEHLHLEQSLISHHLIKLKDRDVLTCQRIGKQVHYQVHDGLLEVLPHLLLDRLGKETVVV